MADPTVSPTTRVQPPAAPSTTHYLACLAAELRIEANNLGVSIEDIHRLDQVEAGTATFRSAMGAYRRVRHAVADALHRRFEIAQGYRSMEEFWEDAVRQERGDSDLAFWDSYENGYRRRIEQVIAATFGAERAVAVNSGMAAIDVVLRSRLQPGSRLLVHERAYFETTELIDHLLAPCGVEVVRTDMTDRDALAAAARQRPDAALVETVVSGPSVDIPHLDVLIDSGVPVLLDNSAIGFALPGSILSAGGEVVIVESGTKYLCREASVGVVLGAAWAEEARATTRRTGVGLQGRGLHHVRPGEIAHVRDRLLIHTHRLSRFVERLRDESDALLTVTTALNGAEGRGDLLARLVHAGAGGCTAYVRYRRPPPDVETACRRGVAGWAAAIGGRRIRAGFGWTDTSARAYGADRLNTAAGHAFVRVSVGIEPEEDVVGMASAMAHHLITAGRC
jgi:cystathionine beta-lyase/cystathionine gamma-synthase